MYNKIYYRILIITNNILESMGLDIKISPRIKKKNLNSINDYNKHGKKNSSEKNC